jgi:penicillin-binding protein 2
MTISQGGTGSGGSGEAVRRIYEAMYGIKKDTGTIDPKKGIMPQPVAALPKISGDGAVERASVSLPAPDMLRLPDSPRTAGFDGPVLAALTPTRTDRLLYGRKYTA